MKNLLIGILLIVVIVLGFLLAKPKFKNTQLVNPTPIVTTQTGNQNQQNTCSPNDPASITITNPIGGETFTPGQTVSITWTSCNVDNVFIGWAQGGHDKGLFSENPTSASQGSYQWTVPNYPDVAGNNYWIAVSQAVPQPHNTWTSGIFAKSGTFTIQ